jgi:excinuclease ABC subunit B
MRAAIDETNRRREIQRRHNEEHHITPQGIVKSIRDLTDRVRVMAEARESYDAGEVDQQVLDPRLMPKDEVARLIKQIEKEMKDAAKALEFERAAALRDQLMELRAIQVEEKLQLA